MAEPPATAPDEIDPDRILNDWALDEADLREVRRARGPDSRLWTALHLCSVRRTGRFIDDPAQVPRGAVLHLARQLAIEPPARLAALARQPTDSAIRARVRDHLGFVPLSADARNRLEADLSAVAADGMGTADLLLRAEAVLSAAKVILPAPPCSNGWSPPFPARPWTVCSTASPAAFPHPCARPSTGWSVS